MPRPPKTPSIQSEFFTWRMFRRSGVWYADGRSSSHRLGKHSLGTRDRAEALENLKALDRKCAVDRGLASPSSAFGNREIPIAEGWQRFLDHRERPAVMGGVSMNTRKRYRAVRDKHLAFCESGRIESWHQVNKAAVESYGRYLTKKKYAPRSLYLELTTIKTVHGWLIDAGHLPDSLRFKMPLRRPEGTDTYCFNQEQVNAMINHCQADEELQWLADVIIALACTGMRISELASLRHSDIDVDANLIRLKDERAQRHKNGVREIRTTKGGRGRTIPIHPRLREVIDRLPSSQDGRLLHGPRGGKLKPDTIRNVLIRDVLKPLKKRFPSPDGERGFADGRLHSFRHYFVSQAFLAGVGEGEIMSWVGHRDSQMVAHYRHLRDEDARRKMNQINFLGANGVSDGPTSVASNP